MIVLAIDPGSAKCGLAAVSERGILHREIVPTQNLLPRLSALRSQLAPDVLLLGNGTQSAALAPQLPDALLVPEAYTSQRARERLRASQPWWKRLVPSSDAYDDWVAVILAEDWLAATQESGAPAPNDPA